MQNALNSFDVVIIGGSLAGATCASYLRNSALRVAIVEASPNGLRPCGEGMSYLCEELLRETASPLLVIVQQCSAYSEYQLVFSKFKRTLSSTGKQSKNRIAERSVIDRRFLSAVSEHCTVFADRVDTLQQDVSGRGWLLHTGTTTLKARSVVLATGRTAGLLPYPKAPPSGSRRLSVTLRWTCSKAHQLKEVEIIPFRFFELYLTPLSDFVLNITALGSRGKFPTLVQITSEVTAFLKSRDIEPLPGQAKVMGASGFEHRSPRFAEDGLFFVGDAAETFDPASGLGMYHAMFTGFSAAHHIGCSGNAKEAIRNYQRQICRHNRVLRIVNRLTVSVSSTISSSPLLRILARLHLLAILAKAVQFLLSFNLKRSLPRTYRGAEGDKKDAKVALRSRLPAFATQVEQSSFTITQSATMQATLTKEASNLREVM